ncbi:hypothetical protein F5Y19DRAFT_394985 [Xylariaceae sp. FL1651]|nr:hypothetical protein F5Y19DRAFT_394985 [Xylariaceae sp. FL1651]
MTFPGRAGCFLQYCTIAGVVAGEPSESALTRLLTNAIVNLKRTIPRTGVVSLQVNAESRPENIFNDNEQSLGLFCQDDSVFVSNPCRALRIIWRTAQQTSGITMAALRVSHLSVSEHFKRLSAVQRCSLSYRDARLPITQLASTTAGFNLSKG